MQAGRCRKIALKEARVLGKRKMAALVTATDTIPISPVVTESPNESQPEATTCYCCGLVEECTVAYIAAVSKRYNGRWICGLCSEAVNEEICRSTRLISTEEAVNRHVSFLKRFEVGKAEQFIEAVRQIVRRSLDTSRAVTLSVVSGTGGSSPSRLLGLDCNLEGV